MSYETFISLIIPCYYLLRSNMQISSMQGNTSASRDLMLAMQVSFPVNSRNFPVKTGLSGNLDRSSDIAVTTPPFFPEIVTLFSSSPLRAQYKKYGTNMWAFLSFLILVPWIAYTQITFFSGYESKEDTALVQRLAKALLATESIYLKDHIPGDWDIVCLTPYYYKAIDLPPPNIRNIEEFEIDRFDINENEKYKKIVLYNLKNKKIHFYNINNRQMIIDRAIVETDCVEFQTSTLRKNTKAYNAYSYIWE